MYRITVLRDMYMGVKHGPSHYGGRGGGQAEFYNAEKLIWAKRGKCNRRVTEISK
jgi:hypothetical protein